MTERDRYKLSTYRPIEILRQTDSVTVELVECSLDGKRYIKKTYPEDKRTIFNALAKISDQHIPCVYEVFFDADTIVIEQFVEGKTLGEMISAEHRFSRKEASGIFRDLADALQVLHSNDIIHRDIKPENIIVQETGVAVLIDYSIARRYSEGQTADTELFGTVGYAAPEQFGFSQTDYRTDIYALGMTMKKITGRGNASGSVNKAVSRCIEFDPSKRFQTAAELKKYLAADKKVYAAAAITTAIMTALLLILFWHDYQDELSLPSDSGSEVIGPSTEQNENDGRLSDGSVNENTTLLPEESSEGSEDSEGSERPPAGDSGDGNAPSPSEDESINTPSAAAPTEDPVDGSSLIYEYDDSRIIQTADAGVLIPCLQLHQNGAYSVGISLGGNAGAAKVEATKSDTGIDVTINGETTYSFAQDTELSTLSYPNGGIFAEILFYDLNNDGVCEIIPVLCNAVAAEWPDGEISLLKNYSLAWCIYYDQNGVFQLADGKMTATLDPFRIYVSAADCIWADFPSYYKFIDGELILI